MSLLAREETANPLIILDEIEKSRGNRAAADPVDAVLPLLQRNTARTFRCPSLRVDVDLSHVSWAMSANEVGRLPAPLLDRVKVFHCGAPRGKELRRHVERRLGKYAVDDSVVRRVVLHIERGNMSLRGLSRLEEEFRRLDRGGPTLN